jgi:hypothetical protein
LFYVVTSHAGISLDVPGVTELGRPPILQHLYVELPIALDVGKVLMSKAPPPPTKVLSDITAARPRNTVPLRKR